MATKKQLIYTLADEDYYDTEGSTMGIGSNNSVLLKKEARSKSWSVTSSLTGKVLFTGKTRKLCAEFVERKTGKKVVFSRA